MTKQYFYFAFLSLILSACTGNSIDEPEQDTGEKEEEVTYYDEAKIRIHVEAQLKILATEKYDLKIYEEDLNGDVEPDKVITVNVLDRAINEAIASNKVAKRVEMGYMGNYNYIFYVDGKSQVITSPIALPSSPQAELKVSFEYLTNEVNKDLIIDYRIRNSAFRNFYTIKSRVPIQVSTTELFTDLGRDKQEVFFIELEENPNMNSKNIVVYKGKADPISFDDPDAVYSYQPNITKTNELVRRWYYSPKYMKYYLRKDEM